MKRRMTIVAALAIYAATIHLCAAQTLGYVPRPMHATSCANVAASKSGTLHESLLASGETVVLSLDTIFLSEFECTTGGPYGGGEPSGPGGTVTATIVDETGAPVTGQPAYLCGLNICDSPVTTQANGNVNISSNLSMTRPAFHVGDAINYPIIAVQLTPNSTTNFGTLQSGKFPSVGSGSPLTPGTVVVSGDITLTIPVNADVGIDTLTYDTPDRQKFRSISIPVNASSAPLLPCQNCGFEMLFGVAPSETVICPAAQITIALPHQTQSPNDFNWPANAIVEMWTTTIDTTQTYAPYAGWRLISYGHVSADGTSVTSETWGGLNFLSNLAVRLAQ